MDTYDVAIAIADNLPFYSGGSVDDSPLIEVVDEVPELKDNFLVKTFDGHLFRIVISEVSQ